MFCKGVSIRCVLSLPQTTIMSDSQTVANTDTPCGTYTPHYKQTQNLTNYHKHTLLVVMVDLWQDSFFTESKDSIL